MFYEFSLTIPADTPESEPVSVDAALVAGTIEHVEVQFWAGHRGNVHVRILEQEHQVWPTNVGDWLTSEAYTISFDEHYVLVDRPYTLLIEGWNEDTDYDHQIIVRFSVSVGRWTIADLASMLGGPVEVIA